MGSRGLGRILKGRLCRSGLEGEGKGVLLEYRIVSAAFFGGAWADAIFTS
jgi:hypothetical protein